MKKTRKAAGKKREPNIIVVSGPAGAGKTTLLKKLFLRKKVKDNFIQSISCTTRPRRPKEKSGRDYIFISREEFRKKQRGGFFLEWEKVLEDYYGTPNFFLAQAKQENKDLILCIDVKGGMHLKKSRHKKRVVTVFISAPTSGDLNKRLVMRDERNDIIKKRIELAKKELQFARSYDYLIINRDIKKSLQLLESVLIAQKNAREE